MPLYAGYKALMKNYVGLQGASSPQDRLFACPADAFFPSFLLTNTWRWYFVREGFHHQESSDFSSYVFNGGDNVTRTNQKWNIVIPFPGLTGVKSAGQEPSLRQLFNLPANTLALAGFDPQGKVRHVKADAGSAFLPSLAEARAAIAGEKNGK